MQLKKATKKKVKLRLGLSAVSGGGKTYGALLLAKGLVGDWSKIAVIDTENDSASLYSELGGEDTFNTISLTSPYTPERYIEAIIACENAGIECIIIDSITHEWDGKGGCLEMADAITKSSNSKNSYTSWSSITPRHQSFIDKILQSSCHIITTVRRKQDYDMVKENGRTFIVKLGMKEITREGFEYELSANLNIELNHYCTASKDRTGIFDKCEPFVITEETGLKIRQWCATGVDEVKEAIEKVNQCVTVIDLTTLKNTLNNFVVKHQSFIDAAIAKYKSITPIIEPKKEEVKEPVSAIEKEIDNLVKDFEEAPTVSLDNVKLKKSFTEKSLASIVDRINTGEFEVISKAKESFEINLDELAVIETACFNYALQEAKIGNISIIEIAQNYIILTPEQLDLLSNTTIVQ